MKRINPKGLPAFERGMTEMVRQNMQCGSTREIEREKVAAILKEYGFDGGLNYNFSEEPAITILPRN